MTSCTIKIYDKKIPFNKMVIFLFHFLSIFELNSNFDIISFPKMPNSCPFEEKIEAIFI